MYYVGVPQGTFSPKSDVWSFGVTLWEILTFARDQPFEGLSDEQVIENCGHYYRHDGQQVLLPAPALCPKEIFDLVCACWHRDHTARPTFGEIHMFLQRKNMGYNPCDEKQINSLPIA
jgi:discoidin domain receptor family protein 2